VVCIVEHPLVRAARRFARINCFFIDTDEVVEHDLLNVFENFDTIKLILANNRMLSRDWMGQPVQIFAFYVTA
jgi:hypothetical protein